MGVSTDPNAAEDQEWRQATGYGYSGNLVAAPSGDPYSAYDIHFSPIADVSL